MGRVAGVREGSTAWSGPCRFMKTFLFLRETWDFIFTRLLEIVLERLDWNVFRVKFFLFPLLYF